MGWLNFGKSKQQDGTKSGARKTILTVGMTAFLAAGGGVGVDKTLKNEGMELVPYYDSGLILTWCGGETDLKYYKDKFTLKECTDLFARRYGFFSYAVAMLYGEGAKASVTPPMHAAFVDTAYNIGLNGFKRSSILLRADRRESKQACDAILLYKRAAGKDCSLPENKKICGGIWTRRKDMVKICYSGL